MMMKLHFRQLFFNKFIFILMFIVGTFAILPSTTIVAQSCNAGEQSYRIARGDNLYRISLRFGVSMQAIANRNGISDFTRIFAGNILCIPAGGNVVTTVQTVVQTTTTTTTTTTTFNPLPAPNAQTISTNPPFAPVTVQPGQENWCSNGGPWDDGRCIVPGNPALQDYWFLAGWCNAQVQLGNYMGTVDDCLNGVQGMNSSGGGLSVVAFNLNGEDFGCSVHYDQSSGQVASLAKWDDEYDDQIQVIWFTDLPNLFSYAVNIDKKDERATSQNASIPGQNFKRASAKIRIEDGEDIGIVPCIRVIS